MSFLYWRSQNWMQCSRHGLMSAEQMGIISSLSSPAILLLTQPRMFLDFFAASACSCLLSSLLTTRTSRLFSEVVPPSWSVPSRFISSMKIKMSSIACVVPSLILQALSCIWPLSDNPPHPTSDVRRVTSTRLPVCHSHVWPWGWTLLTETLTHRLTLALPQPCPTGDQCQTGPRLAALHSPLDHRPAAAEVWASGTNPGPALLMLPGHRGMRAQAGAEGPRQVPGQWNPGAVECWGFPQGWYLLRALSTLTAHVATTGALAAVQDKSSYPKAAADGLVRRQHLFFSHGHQ